MTSQLTSIVVARGWNIKYSLLEAASGALADRTLVFVHGTPWSSAVFASLASALNATYGPRILLYDHPGYGESRDTTSTSAVEKASFAGDTSVASQAEILSALLSHLQLDGKKGRPVCDVIAHDIAGAIVLRAHLLHGCEFGSMMFWDTNGVLPWGDGFYKLCRATPQVFLDMPPSIFEAVARAVIKSAISQRSEATGQWEKTLLAPWLGEDGQKAFIRQIAQADDADVKEMLDQELYGKVRCDVKILWGEKDEWIPKWKLEKLGELMGDRFKGLTTVPDASHLVMIDQPERVAAETIAWLMR